MTAEALIQRLSVRGVRLYPEGAKLIAEPASRLTDADRQAIRQCKAELLAALTRSQAGAEADPEADRIASLDIERRARDRVARRGYDFDPTAPSHAGYAARSLGEKEASITASRREADGPRPAASVTPDSRHPLIAPEVRAKIEAIEAEARAKGWPPELLWNAGFWDGPRGLAAVLEPDDEIAEVTPAYIAILKTRRDLLRFRRHVA